MVSEQTMPTRVVGYFAGMLYNANNISGESSPAGFPLELEVGKIVADMLGFDPSQSWTHISSGGTIANIEALWIARTVKPVPFSVREYCQQQDIAYDITPARRFREERHTQGGRPHASCIWLPPKRYA